MSNHWLIYNQAMYDAKRLETEVDVLSENAKMAKLKSDYKNRGMRKSFLCVLLCFNSEGFPCVIVKRNLTDGRVSLFGGKLQAGESVKDAIRRKLDSTIGGLDKKTSLTTAVSEKSLTSKLFPSELIGECLSVYWRPNFDTLIMPFLSSHVSRPKERIEVYQVKLPEQGVFMIRKKSNHLDIVPIHDLPSTDDLILNAVPSLIGKYNICRMEKV